MPAEEKQTLIKHRRTDHAHSDRAHLKNKIKKILSKHKGYDNPITMVHLFKEATGQVVIPNRKYDQTRCVRSIVQQLRSEGLPIVSRSGISGGYFLANNDEEIQGTINNLHSRAMSMLRTEASLKRIDINKLFEQYTLELKQQEKPNDSQEAA